MRRLLFVFNPHSGTGKVRKKLAEVLDIFVKASYEVIAYPTQAAEDGMRKILSDGADYDRIIVAGGDGMLHELVNAAVRLPKAITVGYLPTGTVNDFAATNHIPVNLTEAAKIAVSNHIHALDVGRFQDKYFSYVAAFGMVTSVAYETDQKMKNRLGSFAYFIKVLQSIDLEHFDAACRQMTIQFEDNILTGEFVFGAISNSKSIAGMRNFLDDNVILDDGILEGLFIRKPRTLFELEQMKKGLVDRDFHAACLVSVKAENFMIHSEPVAWTLDGESGGEHETVEISVKKQALKIALPENVKTCS